MNNFEIQANSLGPRTHVVCVQRRSISNRVCIGSDRCGQMQVSKLRRAAPNPVRMTNKVCSVLHRAGRLNCLLLRLAFISNLAAFSGGFLVWSIPRRVKLARFGYVVSLLTNGQRQSFHNVLLPFIVWRRLATTRGVVSVAICLL